MEVLRDDPCYLFSEEKAHGAGSLFVWVTFCR